MASLSGSSVCRTATDALQSKHSAVCLQGYRLLAACENDKERSYKVLLSSMADNIIFKNKSSSKNRRQTALVNIGYAVRVACVLQSIESFVRFYSTIDTTESSSGIQIVFLGAGLDVTGLWALSLLAAADSNFRIHVCEVDFPAICAAKREAIQELNLLDEKPPDGNSPQIVWQGQSRSNPCCTYSLIAADLQDDHDMDAMFASSTMIDPGVPILFVSELVLAYLGKEACDNLLRRCADCTNSCVVLAYEPLGPSMMESSSNALKEMEEAAEPVTVGDSYRRAYYEQFDSKLKRGEAFKKQQSQEEDKKSHFFPLGASCGAVEQRLCNVGFEYACAVTAGHVAATMSLPWQSREQFDEHAALVLHLTSYTVACAFTAATEKGSGKLLRRVMCDWASPGLFGRPRHITLRSTGASENSPVPCWLSSIECEDERQACKLFSEAYKHHAEQYPAVRKMLKGALRNVFGVGNRRASSSPQNGEQSVIGKYFRERGGDFIVCTRNIDSNEGDTGIDERRVLGGIGIRELTKAERSARELLSSDAIYYEIHHLFVDDEMRGCGIATALLDAALDMVARTQSRRRKISKVARHITVVATTISFLESANHFYAAKGFTVRSEVLTNDLLMRTYMKTIPLSTP